MAPLTRHYGRTCEKCERVVADDNAIMDGPSANCRACYAEKRRKSRASWTPEQRERAQERARKYLNRLRVKMLQAYGGECQCCGETEPEFLCIDHVNGDGAEHRRQLRVRQQFTSNMLRIVAREGFPDRYRLLCWNCNYGMTRPGGCPHQRR
jgi:hypothetical protein